jgi:ABC-type sulfate transport system permease component
VAALLSWLASLSLFGALLVLGYHLTYTTATCINC